MTKNKIICLVAIVVMAIVSFSNFFGVNIAGLSVIVGIAFFFINRFSKRNITSDDSLNVKAIGTNLKDKSIWFWIFSPTIMNVICFTLATMFLPEFIEHIYNRTEFVISLDKIFLLVLQLAIFAIGEEIAWRGFFQKQLSGLLPIIPTLILTSIIFSFGHFAAGNIAVVSYDIFFIFINSVLYGVVFYKTNNAWISAISHFIANLSGAIVIILFF
ncbi:type II CAAX endopeptidase family protein [Lysinibacillus sp. KU-BSD001]|uniref:CPBP family intramembrane glutamic endopeptidase n=1 Tax=Lysinibacillus sp. KU-BSD001 TaxID=3141328 RepID=UPI0036E67A0C